MALYKSRRVVDPKYATESAGSGRVEWYESEIKAVHVRKAAVEDHMGVSVGNLMFTADPVGIEMSNWLPSLSSQGLDGVTAG